MICLYCGDNPPNGKVMKICRNYDIFFVIFAIGNNGHDMRTRLLGLTPAELSSIAVSCGLPSYAGKQIARHLYVRKVRSFDEMTDISREGRARLAEAAEIGLVAPSGSVLSSDGTRKYIFPVETELGGKRVESCVEAVMIPDGDRKTLCVSSQAGCRMGCHFCMTGRQGFHGNLSASQILSQLITIDESDSLTNVVFMGMGEPLDNWDNVRSAIEAITAPWGFAWSPKRVTLSTIGVIPKLRACLDELKCHIAVSLHDPFPEERLSIMPVQKAWPLADVLSLLREYDFTGQRRVSFEYTMFAGFNDTKAHADALARAVRGLECRVNLIRFHKIPDFPYESSSDEAIEAFRRRLSAYGVTATVRASRGEDILAACGMLAGKFSKTSL